VVLAIEALGLPPTATEKERSRAKWNEGYGKPANLPPENSTGVREPRTERARIVIKERMRRRITLALALVACLALAASAAGCGSSGGGDSTHPNYAKDLAGAPAPLADLYGEANQLLSGGRDAFEERVASLGYPAVANIWASWCGPCRSEFAIFQEVSARLGKKVGFIGVDSEDEDSDAEEFLHGHPVPYPSYTDPHHELAASVKASGLPDTVFYDDAGEVVFVKRGPYTDAAELEADIGRYALKGA
jgi:cytochrome c biogenesis protein CcmG, thiol:disulfide interchange protein DsbE